ncbi:hypothetical protein ACFPTY_03025 [Halomonas beimenensis]|uniref:Cell division protein ZipA n=1 Tax=Halomonas beimenensis TaxID=475662 RepID=A0A291P4W9_9GAMM|nr:hypothetical protein [Halomonas beimenensis]ATJ81930.1 hypothetical protein BEI_0943 [Halomonas beimenensis]
MDMTKGVMLLAGGALAMALLALGLFLYLRRGDGEPSEPAAAPPVRERSAAPPAPAPPPSAAPAPSDERPSAAHRFRVSAGGEVKQCLFVVLDWPGLDTNRRLNKLLEEAGAVYDPKQRVYNVRPPRTGYRMVVANSSPPGGLPPLHEEGEHPIVDGISILVHFRNKRRVANSPDALIDFTRSVAAIGGRILDAERHEVSDEDFAALRGAPV